MDPTSRLFIIQLVHKGLITPLIYHWYREHTHMNKYLAFLALRPILKRKDRPPLPLKASDDDRFDYAGHHPKPLVMIPQSDTPGAFKNSHLKPPC